MTNELIELAERLDLAARKLVAAGAQEEANDCHNAAAMLREVQEEMARMRMELIVMRRTLELGGSPMSVVGHITRLLRETNETD